ncbi:MAG: hypothetical protein GC191_12305 [Azospirillum sp.]|nr:hypothetical protein [Azospirillum sp.]
MSDIFREVEEDIRRDRMERLARRYGPFAVGLIALIVAGTAGYVAWNNWQQRQAAAETQRLVEAVSLQAGSGGGEAAASALADFAAASGGARSALALFYAAGLRARAGATADAVKLYDDLAARSDLGAEYRDLATVLSISHQIDDAAPESLSARLAPLTAANNPWRHRARELAAMLAVRTKDLARAKALFQELADDATVPAGLRARAGELAALYGRS